MQCWGAWFSSVLGSVMFSVIILKFSSNRNDSILWTEMHGAKERRWQRIKMQTENSWEDREKDKEKISNLHLKLHYLRWMLIPLDTFSNLPRFPQGNIAEIVTSIKLYRQFIVSLQAITWFRFPSREELYHQSGRLFGGEREADAQHSSFSQIPEDGRGQHFVHLKGFWSSLRLPSSFRFPSCHHSLLASIHWGVSEESSDVFSESVALSYASFLSVYFHLQYCWRLDGGCQKQGDGILEN